MTIKKPGREAGPSPLPPAHNTPKKPFRWTRKARKFCDSMARMDSPTKAAAEIGLNERYAFRLLKKPEVQKEIAKRREKKQDALDKQEAKKIVIDRESVVIKLWELANMDAFETNKTIAGQVKALAEIAEILGMKIQKTADVSAIFRGKTPEECEYYAIHGFFAGEKPKDQA